MPNNSGCESLMNKIRVVWRILLSISCILFGQVYAEPPNLDIARRQIEAYHDTGAYIREITSVIHCARQYINRRIENNRHSLHPRKLAIVLDIDETSLSDYQNMVQRKFLATKAQLYQEYFAAHLTPIKPTRELYREAIRRGVAVFFITGRQELFKQPTLKNLRRAGYSQWKGIYFKPNQYQKASTASYKMGARADIVHKGYTIIANIGDQYSDLKGGYANAWFKLPNPFYYLP